MIKLSPKNNSDIIGIIHQYPVDVMCTVKSTQSDYYSCENAITPSKQVHYVSNTSEGQFYEFRMLNVNTRLTHYSIKAPNTAIGDINNTATGIV